MTIGYDIKARHHCTSVLSLSHTSIFIVIRGRNLILLDAAQIALTMLVILKRDAKEFKWLASQSMSIFKLT